MAKALLVLAVVLATYYAYYLIVPDAVIDYQRVRSWYFYIMQGALGAVALFLLTDQFKNRPSRATMAVGVSACWFGVLEESKVAVCGLAEFNETWRPVSDWTGLCNHRFGPYSSLVVALIVVVWAWTRRGHDRKTD